MRVAKLVGRVPPTKRLKKPHREIAQLLAADEERLAKWQKSSYPSSFDQHFYLSPYEQRRLKLLDAVFKGVSNAGGRPSTQRQKNPEELYVNVRHTHVELPHETRNR